MSFDLCFVCGSSNVNFQRNLVKMKSKYSGYSLIIFIKKILRKTVLTRDISDPNNCICGICLMHVNEYDEIAVKAKSIEDMLHKMLHDTDGKRLQTVTERNESSASHTDEQKGKNNTFVNKVTNSNDRQIDLTVGQIQKDDTEISQSHPSSLRYLTIITLFIPSLL